MLNIGNRLECFFDDYLVNRDKTTAEFRIHAPRRWECVLHHDAPWEGDGCDYHNFFYDDGVWRMYYLGWWMLEKNDGIRVCYAESRNGLHWEKPNLGLRDYKGSKDNNIILDATDLPGGFDNFMVFRDDNPACPPEKRYKGIVSMEWGYQRALGYFYSADAIHFTRSEEPITLKGAFDSLNVAFWDPEKQKYMCYFRGAHAPGDDKVICMFDESHIRDIRVMESEDFVTWTEPRLMDFGDGEDVPLYTNVVQPYPRAPHIYVGFPSRYQYRTEWNGSFEELCGRERRLYRNTFHPRYGQTITDCVFITSRDGQKFTRYDEAFMRPEAESPYNWMYGDCYPARGILETPNMMPGGDPEISLLVPEKHWSGEDTKLYRYSLRREGFVSLHAGGRAERIETKPFVYEGGELRINFATSARGYLRFALINEDGERFESEETFGNKTDRRVHFLDDGVVARLSGKPVVLEAELFDADLYAIQFQ
ncbi:MAG: hypothetical protein IJF34_04490 [Clostridia bacterium]|nr:hypothetical protein [Clostridia bacterium]